MMYCYLTPDKDNLMYKGVSNISWECNSKEDTLYLLWGQIHVKVRVKLKSEAFLLGLLDMDLKKRFGK